MTSVVTLNCLDCGKEFQTEEVSLMGHMFFQERYCPNCLVIERGTDVLPLKEGRTRLQTIATIKEVTKRNIEPKSGAAPFTLFEIEDSEGTKWTTKKQGLALEAHSLVGKLVSINGTIKENGNFKNYYLEGLTEAQGVPDTFTQTNGNSNTFRDTSGDNQESIYRQVATKVAAVLSDDSPSFWENVNLLMTYYRTGEQPGQEGNFATAAAFTDVDSDIPF